MATALLIITICTLFLQV